MNKRRASFIAIYAGLVPLIGISGGYLISANNGSVPWCFPLMDGCTSISKAARQPESIWFFRTVMIVSAVFLVLYWHSIRNWISELSNSSPSTVGLLYTLGVISAVSLVVYIIFLGTHGVGYKFMRRFGVIVYFATFSLAELLLVWCLEKIAVARKNNQLLRVSRHLLSVCIILILLAIANVAVEAFIKDRDYINNIIEWNFAVVMHFFFFVTAWYWFKEKNAPAEQSN